MVKIFRLLLKSSLMAKVSKFSIKSEAVIHVCTTTIKKLFWKCNRKNSFAWASFQIKLQAYSLKLLFKKAPVHVFSRRFCQIFKNAFLAKHVRVTPSAKYPFLCTVNLSHKMLTLTLLFLFYFRYFQHKHVWFLKDLGK